MDPSRDRVTDDPASSPPDGGDATAAAGKTPDYGLLSRTLVHSSVVKQILPARIRGADYANDVVFVGVRVIIAIQTAAALWLSEKKKSNQRAEIWVVAVEL